MESVQCVVNHDTIIDLAVVRSMVFIGSALYILGLLLTDLSYTLVDPRVRLE